MIWHLPLEQYEERYTEQWYRWFDKELKDSGKHFTTIEGKQLTSTIDEGSVLDACGTNYYKMTQLASLIEHIRAGHVKDNDTIFFADLWFPGIESLQYIRDVTGRKFKITGIFHAGTWDKADFTYRTGMRDWAKFIEAGWLSFIDTIYVGSEFHKEIIGHYASSIVKIKANIIVTGLPFEADEVNRSVGVSKRNIVVFPHRLDPEKRPDLFDLLYQVPGWQFVKSKEVTKSKEEYYQLLGKSKIAVSFAEQETFGYAMLEALANGCYPVVINGLSYATMDIYNDFKVNSIEEADNKIKWFIGHPKEAQAQIKEAQQKLTQYKTKEFIKNI